MVVLFCLRLGRWAASAPGFRSAFCSGLGCASFGSALACAFGARHARSRVRGGGGGGDGAWRGGRLFVFLAAPWARCWRGLCLGPSSLFFAVGANPRRPGSVRSVFGWVGGGCAAKWRYKNTRGVLFLLTEGG